ncbi:energy transducer TonB [Gluconobacter cerinus]|uniref:TonB C-terminal domain-containing protein n=1 Tax=Gluconobacter cerinus TaxID=38307 RepID=A0AAV5NGJ3_9PROT|nr:energy transducer TonB [Gluconobacter cerinus]GLQ63547.1 hypothetical protein GCM10007867_23920 [Gluconobacter cerinus]
MHFSRSGMALAIFGLIVVAPSPAHSDDTASVTAVLDPSHHGRLVYPPAELELRHSGSAHIVCVITKDGQPQSCETSASAPDFALAAEAYAYSSKFLPAYQDSKPIEGRWEKTIPFEARGTATLPVVDHEHSPRPYYPDFANDRNITGRVAVTCQVDTAGIAHDCIASPGPEILRRASLAYFTLARYLPAMKDGQPISAPYHGNINWESDAKDRNDGFR